MRDYQFIGATLLGSSSITALVSTKVYHGLRYGASALSSMPCINYYNLPSKGRFSGMESKTFSIHCRAADPAVARQLGDLVVDLFGGTNGSGTYGNTTTFTVARASIIRDNGLIPEGEAGSYCVPIDVLIVYSVDTVS